MNLGFHIRKNILKSDLEICRSGRCSGFPNFWNQYGVEGEGIKLASPGDITKLTPPFIAKTGGGLVIVTGITDENINYLTQGVAEKMPLNDFLTHGVALCF